MNVQALPKILTDAYALYDSLNLSVTALVLIAVALTVVFVFAAREALSWFFKIDDLKSDVKKVRQLVIEMEAEVRMLQGLLSQNVKLVSAPDAGSTGAAATFSGSEVAGLAEKTTAEPKAQPRFTVTH